MNSSTATLRIAFDTVLAVMQDTGRKVASNGTGETVKMIAAFGRRARMMRWTISRLARFSSTVATLNPCRAGLYLLRGTAVQNTSPFSLLYQTSDIPSVNIQM